MKILHIGNICSTQIIVDSLRKLGHDAQVLITSDDYQDNGADIRCIYDRSHKLDCIIRMKNVAKVASGFDVVHWHSGVARTRLDFLLMKLLHGIPMVVNYHGSETRQGYGMHYQWLVNRKVVATPDLLRWHRDAKFIPNPVEMFDYYYKENDMPVVLHMPTVSRKMKGTDKVISAIGELEDEGYNFRFVLKEGLTRKQALEEIKKCHILIDYVGTKLAFAGYGLVSLEAMSMGKTSVCSMDDYFRSFYPGCPVVNNDGTVDGLKDTLGYLLDNPMVVKQLGIEGTRFVAKYHNPILIAKEFVKIYEEVLNN